MNLTAMPNGSESCDNGRSMNDVDGDGSKSESIEVYERRLRASTACIRHETIVNLKGIRLMLQSFVQTISNRVHFQLIERSISNDYCY